MDFYSSSQKPIVLALGFFDGVHLGHKSLFEKAKGMLAKGDSFALFTIDGKFFKNNSGNIFSREEKRDLFLKQGVELIISARANEEFFSLSANDFLNILFNNYNIRGIVAGQDFTFGFGAKGNAEALKNFCKEKGVKCEICPIVSVDEEKISAKTIKSRLSCGQIEKVNALLGENYFITGKVIHGRGVGKAELFPTANLSLSEEKYKIKSGVYATKTIIDGKEYNSVTNYGNCPTFEKNDFVVETFVLNYNGNLYGKTIKVEFLSYLRDITRFASIEELKKQIKKDTEYFL